MADSSRIYALLDSADNTALHDKALGFAKNALQLSQKKGFKRGIGWANLKMAYLMVEHTPNTNVTHLWQQGIEIAHQLNDPFMLGLAHIQIGKHAMYNGDLSKAKKYFEQALAEYFDKNEPMYRAIFYNDIGSVAGRQGNLEDEINWYLKAMKTHELLGDTHGWANTAGNLANSLFKINQKTDALRYAKEALQIHFQNKNSLGIATLSGNICTMYSSENQLDSAQKYQEIALRYTKLNGQKKHLIQAYSNLSLLLDRQKKYAESLEAIQKSMEICQEINDLANYAQKTRWAAVVAGKLGQTDLMNRYYQIATRLADSLRKPDILRDIFASKATYFKNMGDYKNAYEFNLKYEVLKDSIESAKLRLSIAEMETKYDVERKDFQLAQLHAERTIRQLELDRQKALLEGNRLEAQRKEAQIKLLNKEKQLREIQFQEQKREYDRQMLIARTREQDLQIARQNLLITQKDKELAQKQIQRERTVQAVGIGVVLMLGLLAWLAFNRYQLRKELHEKEALLALRSGISKDLHDEIGSSLTGVNILNELTKRTLNNPPLAQSYLQQAGSSIQQISETLSDIVWNINPNYDELPHLLTRLRRYASDMLEAAEVEYQIHFPENTHNIRLPMDKRRQLYMIFKEAINNLVKYAHATQAKVNLSIEKNRIKLSVSDNGVGFDWQHSKKGNGLQNMQDRAIWLGGTLHIDSAPKQGTHILLDFPV
ncbi:MAG: tetratricopeptide repeat protein [Runella sp.]